MIIKLRNCDKIIVESDKHIYELFCDMQGNITLERMYD